MVDGDVLVRAGEDFGLGVACVVDDGFMQAAEARGAIHRQIVDVERLEDVDHEVAAARGLLRRVLRRRLRVGGNLPRSGRGGFEVGLGRGGNVRRRGGRQRRRAGERRALEEVATADGRRIVSALGHAGPPPTASTHQAHRRIFVIIALKSRADPNGRQGGLEHGSTIGKASISRDFVGRGKRPMLIRFRPSAWDGSFARTPKSAPP